jgi:hypothetical protein
LDHAWLLVVIAGVAVYIWKPLWPHAVARIPLWPWFATFMAAGTLVVLFVRSRHSVRSIFLGAAMLVAYFYFELLGAALYLAISHGRLSRFQLIDYLVVSWWNVLMNSPVVATFLILEMVLVTFHRFAIIKG